jgi:HEPN domain-containing protein
MRYLIECPTCEAVMGADVKGALVVTDEGGGPWKVSLVQCPKCHGAIVGLQDLTGAPDEWDEPSRVWPVPPLHLSWKIPRDIRESLEEAHRCLAAKAYKASVVMSGRALEAVGKHFYSNDSGESKKRPMLRAALDSLHKDQVIDDRLYEWGRALHQERNLAAHPSGTHFKKEDADDVFKFTHSICEYIFVLSAEFNDYKSRRAARAQQPSGTKASSGA